MTPLLPQDAAGRPIPALRLVAGGAQHIPIGGASARSSLIGADVVALCPEVDCYVATGDATVTASAADHYLPAKAWIAVSLGDGRSGIERLGDGRVGRHTHIAVVAAGGETGTLHISSME